MKDRTKRILTTALWLLSAVLFALTGYYTATKQSGTKPDIEANAAETRLSPKCRIELTYKYTLCSHEETVYPNPRAYIDFSVSELSEAIPGARIRDFSTEHALAEYTIHQYCPRHLILRSDDSALVVQRTVSGTDKLETVKHIGIAKDSLSASEIERLSYGIVFGSEAELNDYIAYLRK